MTPPKVFLSHATEDKLRFVNEFARRLRSKGIDAWFDKWEILPGDSFVDKIFEEGLKEADTVIIILSVNSVSKPWVREELNSSVVAKIQKGTRLIPVVIDKCEVPEALKATAWEIINDISNYDDSFERISAAILGESLKPPLGQPPAYVSTVLHNIDGLEAIDNLILKRSGELLLENPDYPIDPKDLFGESNAEAPSKSVILDSIDVLESRGYCKVIPLFGGPEYWGHYQVMPPGFEEYCKAYVIDYGNIVDKAVELIVSQEADTNSKLRDALGIPLIVADHVIRVLESKGHIRVSDMGGRLAIYDVSATLQRKLR